MCASEGVLAWLHVTTDKVKDQEEGEEICNIYSLKVPLFSKHFLDIIK